MTIPVPDASKKITLGNYLETVPRLFCGAWQCPYPFLALNVAIFHQQQAQSTCGLAGLGTQPVGVSDQT